MKSLLFVLSLLALITASISASAADIGLPPPPPGFGHGPGPGWGHPVPPPPGFGHPVPPPMRQQYVECSSAEYRMNRCMVNGFIRNAQIVRQESGAACNLGQSWGFERNSIWVDRGCRGTFLVYLQ